MLSPFTIPKHKVCLQHLMLKTYGKLNKLTTSKDIFARTHPVLQIFFIQGEEEKCHSEQSSRANLEGIQARR